MDYVKYDFGYMYAYSERPGTLAARKMEDDVPEETKIRRLMEIVEKQREHSLFRSKEYVGQVVEVLIDKTSKKSENDWSGHPTRKTSRWFSRVKITRSASSSTS